MFLRLGDFGFLGPWGVSLTQMRTKQIDPVSAECRALWIIQMDIGSRDMLHACVAEDRGPWAEKKCPELGRPVGGG